MRRAFSNSMGLAAMVGLVLALVAPAVALFAPALAQAETEEQAKDEGPRSPLRWVAETESPRSAQPTGPLYRACGGRDLGLVSVAAQIVRRRLRGMPPPSERQLETLLRASGVPQVFPRAWSLRGDHGDEVIATKLGGWLAKRPPAGHRRCGIARGTDAEGVPVVVVVTVDAFADQAALPTRARVSKWLRLEAALHVPAHDAKVVLLGPRGRPKRVLASLSGDTVRSRFMLDAPGRWLVQVVADLSSGPQPVLESTVWVDRDPPDTLPEELPTAAGTAAPKPSALFTLLNRSRQKEGLPPLHRDQKLDRIARDHAAAMMTARRAAHDVGQGPPTERVERAGLVVHRVGENVASAPTVARVHEALWDSPSHRENMLDASFRRTGVALAIDRTGQLWAVQLFSE
ncbi:MAG: CAP domain-containing protein [Polyangiaceae bacterium]